LAKLFQSRRFLEINQSETRIACDYIGNYLSKKFLQNFIEHQKTAKIAELFFKLPSTQPPFFLSSIKIAHFEFIVSKIDIMSGGSNSLKPGQPRSTNINTVQTLLKAKLGSTYFLPDLLLPR
jgi:hypothetical protein